jgi:hypothetical protein
MEEWGNPLKLFGTTNKYARRFKVLLRVLTLSYQVVLVFLVQITKSQTKIIYFQFGFQFVILLGLILQNGPFFNYVIYNLYNLIIFSIYILFYKSLLKHFFSKKNSFCCYFLFLSLLNWFFLFKMD